MCFVGHTCGFLCRPLGGWFRLTVACCGFRWLITVVSGWVLVSCAVWSGICGYWFWAGDFDVFVGCLVIFGFPVVFRLLRG